MLAEVLSDKTSCGSKILGAMPIFFSVRPLVMIRTILKIELFFGIVCVRLKETKCLKRNAMTLKTSSLIDDF